MLLDAAISSDAWGNIRWLHQDPQKAGMNAVRRPGRWSSTWTAIRDHRWVESLFPAALPHQGPRQCFSSSALRLTFSLILKHHTLPPSYVQHQQHKRHGTLALAFMVGNIVLVQKEIKITWVGHLVNFPQQNHLPGENYENKYIIYGPWKLSWGPRAKGIILIQDHLQNVIRTASICMSAMTCSFNSLCYSTW